MIATSICQKALAVLLMILIITVLLGCNDDELSNTTAGTIPLAMGIYIGYLRIGADSMPEIEVTLSRVSDSTIRVMPGTDFMQPFVCEVMLDDGILQNVNDSSSNFFSINTASNDYELEILQGGSQAYFHGLKLY